MTTYGDFIARWNKQEGSVLEFEGWGGTMKKASDLDMATFAEKLAKNKKLTSLTLLRTKHTTNHATLLAAALSKNTVLQSLKLRELQIMDDGIFALARALRTNKSLTSFEISTSLGMTSAGMGTAGVKELCSALKTNQSLKHLSLANNQDGLTDAGVKGLGELLGTNQSSLTSLDISDSNVGPAGIIALAQGLSTNTKLMALCIHSGSGRAYKKMAFSSGKGLDSLAALCAALVHNSTLASINMLGIGVSQEAMSLLEAVLPMNDSLRELTLCYAPGADHVMAKVRKPRKKSGVDTCEVPSAVMKWLEAWAGSSSVVAPDSSSSTKKRKRMTEVERLRAANE
jgi:Ran GTPase-activating protein (RanGAP) involved in mRNA processing and transport